MNTNLVAIVDPYSSGALLPGEFKKHAYECVMVQSSRRIPTIYQSSFFPDEFVKTIKHENEIDKTVAQLKQLDVQQVITGSELGVELADQLSERLALPSNGTKLSAARRNKYLMIEAVRKQGLRIAPQFCSNDPEEMIDWVNRTSRWPVVLKPVHSTGSDHISLCHSESEVRKAFDNIIGQNNKLGLANKKVLAQQFLNGIEYVLDTVSCAGNHRITAFWKYEKIEPSLSIGYRSMELLPYHGEIQHQLTQYVTAVLDALEIKYGPSHCEVMWVDGTPVLIEVNARMNGGKNPLISQICSGNSQLNLTVQAYLEPQQFLRNFDKPYRLLKTGILVFLIPGHKGRLKSVPKVSEIKKLQSFYQIHVGAKAGRPAPRVAGWIVLVHKNRDILKQDFQLIRQLEANRLYEIDGLELSESTAEVSPNQ